jgi:hypothetical protein
MMYGKPVWIGYYFIENEADRKIRVVINGVIRALFSGKYSFFIVPPLNALIFF